MTKYINLTVILSSLLLTVFQSNAADHRPAGPQKALVGIGISAFAGWLFYKNFKRVKPFQNNASQAAVTMVRKQREQEIYLALNMPNVLSSLVAEYERELTFKDVHQKTPACPLPHGKISIEATEELAHHFLNKKTVTFFKSSKLANMPGARNVSSFRDPYSANDPYHLERYSYNFSIELEPLDTLHSIQEKLAQCGLSPAEQLIYLISKAESLDRYLEVENLDDLKHALYADKIVVFRKR